MKQFVYHNPTKIIFGENALAELGPETAALGNRCLLVYGKNSIKRTGLYERVCGCLRKAGVATVVEHPGVKPNPTLAHTREGVHKARAQKLEVIVAVGGGSVIDEAKAIAAGAPYDGDLWDFYCGKAQPERALPLVSVLTMPGTGSEMNGGTVITNEGTREKLGFIMPVLAPRVSFLDPALALTVPREQAVYGTVDAISHLMEAYFTQHGGWTPIQDRFSEGVVLSLMEALERILEAPSDLDARATQMWGATWAWNGFAPAGVGPFAIPNHALAHAIGGIYDLPHGVTLSMVIPAWLRHESKTRRERIARFSRQIFSISESSDRSAAEAGILALEAWYRKVGAPVRLRDAGVCDPDIPELARQAATLGRLWGMPDLTAGVAQAIYLDAR